MHRIESEGRMEPIEKLLLDDFDVKCRIEDHVKVDSTKIALCAAELVDSEFKHWKYRVEIRETALRLRLGNATITVEEPVVIHANDADIWREILKFV